MLKVTWLALATVWGTIVVWRDRERGTDSSEKITLSEDNTWGFGQVFPIVLLLLPLVSFSEAVYGTSLLYDQYDMLNLR